MSDITEKYEYVHNIIPDPQVLDVADQFYDAADLLWKTPPDLGVIIPAIINSVLAIELYLKSLCSYSVIKDYQDYGDGVRGGIVTVEPGKKAHGLSNLFERIEDPTKNQLLRLFEESPLSEDEPSFCELIKKFDDTFVRVRYVYEDSSFFTSLNINHLYKLLVFINNAVKSLPEKTSVLK